MNRTEDEIRAACRGLCLSRDAQEAAGLTEGLNRQSDLAWEWCPPDDEPGLSAHLQGASFDLLLLLENEKAEPELLRRIKTEHPHLPVILVTEQVMAEHQQELDRGRLQDVVCSCGLPQEQLLVHVKLALSRWRRERGLRASAIEPEHELARVARESSRQGPEAKYRTVFDNAGDAILVHDLQGRFLDVNRVACERLGYSRDELLAMNLADIDAPEYAAQVSYRVEEIKREGSLRFETIHLSREGRAIPTEVMARTIRFEGREAVMSIARDISRRKALQEELVRNRTYQLEVISRLAEELHSVWSYEDLFRLMIEHLGETVPHDVAAALVKGSQEDNVFAKTERPLAPEVWEDILGKLRATGSMFQPNADPIEPRLMKPLDSAEHGSDQGLAVASLGSAIQMPIMLGNEAGEQELLGVFFLGSEKEDMFSKSQIELLYSVANQCAQSIQRLRSLLQKEMRGLEELVQHMPLGVMLLDTAKRPMIMNDRAKAFNPVLQIRENDPLHFLGPTPLADLQADSQSGSAKPREIAVSNGKETVFEILTQEITAGPFEGCLVLMLQDITEERKRERQARQQDRLATVGQLAAGIAHDFNNMLTILGGYAELIHINRESPEGNKEKARSIQEHVSQAAKLVQQILDFSRQNVSELHPLELASYIKELEKLLQRTLPESISTKVRVLSRQTRVQADPVGLQQVITNLALNAHQAMPDGGELCLEIERIGSGEEGAGRTEPEAAGWVVLRMSDTGEGIAPEHLPLIFDPFYTTKPQGEGTGLGLSQVYGIVEQHGGSIEVDSRIGEGTTFTIFLPACAEDPSEPEGRASIVEGHGETILVVEDDPSVLELGSKLLESFGYKPVESLGAKEAMHIIEDPGQPVDLVITDLVMPEMSGHELVEHLKRTRPELPILVWTGYPLEQEGADVLRSGSVDWIMKPPDKTELATKIRRLLARRQGVAAKAPECACRE